MRETIELRVYEDKARRWLGDDVGVRLSDHVRKVFVQPDEPLFLQIDAIERELRKQGESLFGGSYFHRKYTRAELEAAELFHLQFTRTFEPAGEDCGTEYDESGTCMRCGVGRRQVSDLVLDLRRVPNSADLARTIADEWIVSQRLADVISDYGLTGVKLGPVRHRSSGFGEAIDFTAVPSGRELLERARQAGVAPTDWRFGPWMNRSEQAELMDRFREEYPPDRPPTGAAARPPPITVYQLMIHSRVDVTAPTRFGIDPFDEDAAGEYRCPECGLAGLNVLSELFVARDSWDGSDFAVTRQLVGSRSGLLVPAPLVVVSPRVRELFVEHRLNGARWEVAHLLPAR